MIEYATIMAFTSIFAALFIIGAARLPAAFIGLVAAAIAIILAFASFIYPAAIPYLGLLIGIPAGYGFSFLMERIGIENPIRLRRSAAETVKEGGGRRKSKRAHRSRRGKAKSIYVSEAKGRVTDVAIYDSFDEFIQSITAPQAINSVLEYIEKLFLIREEVDQYQVSISSVGKEKNRSISLVDADTLDDVRDVIQRAITDKAMVNDKVKAILENRDRLESIVGSRFMVIYVDGAPAKIVPLYYGE